MVAKGNKCHVDILTDRSIGGIVPLCPVFKMYWTVSFFNEAITYGPDMQRFFAELQCEASNNYIVPTSVYFQFCGPIL
jgi:hypothetical protein